MVAGTGIAWDLQTHMLDPRLERLKQLQAEMAASLGTSLYVFSGNGLCSVAASGEPGFLQETGPEKCIYQ